MHSASIKLSIIVPAYNNEGYIIECLNSIKNQEIDNYECIIIDDGSTDNTGKICDEYVLNNPCFRVIHQQNMGVSAARNKGIEASTGDFITFVDSDDLLAPETYNKALKTIREEDCDVFCFGIAIYSNTGIALYRFKQSDLQKMYIKFPVYMNSVCNKIFNLKLLRSNNIEFNAKIKTKEDFLVSFKVLSLANGIIYTNEPDYLYRDNSNSATHTYSSNTTKKYRKDENALMVQDFSNFINKKSIKANKLYRYLHLGHALGFVLDYSSFSIKKYKEYEPGISIWTFNNSIKYFLITFFMSFKLYFFVHFFHFLQGAKQRLIKNNKDD